MSLPQYPGKHAAQALITPEVDAEYAAEQNVKLRDCPKALILTFHTSLFELICEEWPCKRLDEGRSLYDLYQLEGQDLGVVGGFGIGAPVAAIVLEELIEAGAETVLSVGYAGALQSDVEMGTPIVCTRALRDEGVSYHYLEPARWVGASSALIEACKKACQENNQPVRLGDTWTISAPYRETLPEIKRYAEEGILTVEMEAAALFAVAQYRDIEAGAMFAVSDYLGPEEWDPQFHAARPALEELLEIARVALA